MIVALAKAEHLSGSSVKSHYETTQRWPQPHLFNITNSPAMQHYKAKLADEAATLALGQQLAKILQPGLCIWLKGDLGAGKTCLSRALLHAAGHLGKVKSPTYTLLETYQVHVAQQSVKLAHFDLYRMNHPEEFTEAGFQDELNSHTIALIEWPEKGEGVIPTPDLLVHLQIPESGRYVEIFAPTEKGQACLARLDQQHVE